MKIHKFQEDISDKVVETIKGSIAIDTEATGLQIPERDKLSLIQLCDEKGEVYISPEIVTPIRIEELFLKALQQSIEEDVSEELNKTHN